MSDKKNLDLQKTEVKKYVIKYLLSHVDMKKSNQTMIDCEQHLDRIRDGNYYVSLQKYGTRSWFIYMIFNHVYYAISVPKIKSVQTDIKLYPIGISVHPSLYEGTIFEGVLTQNKNVINVYIDEVYYIAGEHLIAQSRPTRLNLIQNVINQKMNRSLEYIFEVTPSFVMTPEELKNAYELTKKNTSLVVWNFFPDKLSNNSYMYTLTSYDRIDEVVQLVNLKMRKTGIFDVYNLTSESGEDYGIALVKNLESSKLYKKWFEKESTVLVKCMYDFFHKKWIPIDLVTD